MLICNRLLGLFHVLSFFLSLSCPYLTVREFVLTRCDSAYSMCACKFEFETSGASKTFLFMYFQKNVSNAIILISLLFFIDKIIVTIEKMEFVFRLFIYLMSHVKFIQIVDFCLRVIFQVAHY